MTLAAETANDVSSLGQEPEENIFRERDHISSAATITADLPIPAAIDVNHVDQRSLPESISNVNVDLAAKKSARFEAIDAEAELDMLLDSCSETEFFGSLNMTKRSNTLSYVQQEDTCQLGSAESLNEGHDAKKHAKMPAFDNTIDDLLEETSALININDKTLPHDVKAAPSSSDSVSKSKLLDDFDSWLDTI